MKKAIKWATVVLLSPLVLFLVLAALLYVPPIQQWVAKQVAVYASDATGLHISVEHVDLSFPLDLGVDGILVTRSDSVAPMATDTVAAIRRAVADVELWPLLSSCVVLDELQLHDVRLNTLDIVGDMRLKGTVGELRLLPSAQRTDGSLAAIDLAQSGVMAGELMMSDASMNIFLSDTAAIDTTASAPWRIGFDRITIERSTLNLYIDSAALFSPAATTLAVGMEKGTISDGRLDLGQGRYAVGDISLSDGIFGMDSLFLFTHASLALDSLVYSDDGLQLSINHGSMREQLTTLQLTDLRGGLSLLADNSLQIDTLQAATPHSTLSLRAFLPLAAMSQGGSTPLHVDLSASMGKGDVQLLWPLIAPDKPHIETFLPGALFPLTLRANATGTADSMNIERLSILLPAALRIEASGHATHFHSLDDLLAQLDVRAETYTVLTPLLRQFGLPTGFSVPAGIALTGNVGANGPRYTADLLLRQGGGTARIEGLFHQTTMSYEADLSVNQLNLRHFMPTDSFGMVTANAQLKGQGTDIFSSKTTLQAKADVHRLQYGPWALDSINAHATLDKGLVTATLNSHNALLNGTVDMEGQLSADSINATLTAQLKKADLKRINGIDDPMDVAMNGTFTISTNLKQSHRLQVVADDIHLHYAQGGRYLEKVGLLLVTSPDTVRLRMQSGDFIAKADVSGGYEQLFTALTQIADSVQAQINSQTIDQMAIKKLLPTMKLHVESKQNNPVVDLLQRQAALSFKSLNVDLDTSPLTGINGELRLHSLDYDSTRIDTVRLTLVEKDRGLTFNGQLTNNRRNPQMVFSLLFDGFLEEHGAMIGLRYYDERGQRGVRIGAQAQMIDDGLRFALVPKRPTLGYKEFSVEGNNVLILHKDMKMEADIDLVADDGARLRIYSPEQQDSTLLQDLTISAYHIDLGALSSSVALLPKVQGILFGDFHLTIDAEKNISVASDVSVEGMAYEGSLIGNIGSEFVYLNREDGSHAIDAMLLLDELPVGTLSGSYLTDATLDATLQLERMPLSIVNGFIPDQIIGFEGFVGGMLTMRGKMDQLKANGQLALTDGYLVSEPYGMSMRFPNDTLTVTDSRITLEDFKLYAYNDNPLTIGGTIDFSNMDQMDINLAMRARNMLLINAKQKKQSVAYGKMFVNFMARLTTANSLMRLRGRLDVLGTTDLNYILLDSPLSTDNRMDELVRFTDFTDTTATVSVERPAPESLDMDLTLAIDQGAHVRCALNADQTNYVDLMGGGDLRMRMGADDLTLNGRYTIQNGTMKYSMPIIPLKTFTIKEGSYVEFTGNPYNPTLNLKATERVRASVSTEDGQSRMVSFDCGVSITQTLENMGLEFTISAPEDLQLQGELGAMSSEQRGKLAVTMLTTGMYLADSNASAFSMNTALSSFLQNEINNIASGALNTVNLQVGVDNSTDASGQTRTDYSFSFAKRFWNNRLSVQIGGKISSGTDVQGEQQSFFDNVIMEYRLSPTSNQYLKLFYNQNVYDWLDGYTSEYGGGFIWRRKLDRLIDIFRSSRTYRTSPTPHTSPHDSLSTAP